MLSAQDASQPSAEPEQHDPTVERKKKKKKKRSHDEITGEDGQDHEHREKKKKKKKHRHVEETGDAQTNQLAPEPDSEHGLSEEAAPEGLDVGQEKKKKKKKDKKKRDKGKRKAVAAEPAEQTEPPETDMDPQGSTAALLNAIVAAVSSASPAELGQEEPEAQPEPPAPPMPVPPAPPPGHFIPFPPPPGFPFPPGFGEGSGPFNLNNVPPNVFNELAYGSSDDVLRALQDLDMDKIAGVLKTLGDAANAVNVPPLPPTFPPPPAFVPQPLPLPPTSSTTLGQTPVESSAILGRTGRQTGASTRRSQPANHTSSVLEHQTNTDHAEMLCTKWLSAAKLTELVKSEGLVYKKGKFSATEAQQLADAIEAHRQAHQLTEAQILDIIFPKNEKQRNNQFWTELTRAVPQRPIVAVYHHVRRTHHPLKQQGNWTADEDAALKQAVADLGQQWEKVSQRVGRMSSDCRDRYRNHIVGRDVRKNGPWSKEEEDELTRIVTDMTVKQGRDPDTDVFWGRVSELMGGRRGRQQCRIKWTDSLSKLLKTGEGEKPRWSQQDAYILVHKVDSLNVRDDTEIDWKTLPDPDWNLWSAHSLQRRWLTMKKSIKGYEDMTHQEIMDILRVKKAHAPTDSVANNKKRKSRKITSATIINDDTPAQAEAGSSTGPGTLGQARS
ncbi:nucleolar protein [Coprinopsis cinerea AmutBmut pab1-1]|nr:nucleolar protein [Coprinopsis cinerea AmutBmut pab1-1]